jgi:hypothetical protein
LQGRRRLRRSAARSLKIVAAARRSTTTGTTNVAVAVNAGADGDPPAARSTLRRHQLPRNGAVVDLGKNGEHAFTVARRRYYHLCYAIRPERVHVDPSAFVAVIRP